MLLSTKNRLYGPPTHCVGDIHEKCMKFSIIDVAWADFISFILESLSFDESKFKLELFSSVCVKLIPKITENGTNSDQSENKENQPQLTNGNSDKGRVRKIFHQKFLIFFVMKFA